MMPRKPTWRRSLAKKKPQQISVETCVQPKSGDASVAHASGSNIKNQLLEVVHPLPSDSKNGRPDTPSVPNEYCQTRLPNEYCQKILPTDIAQIIDQNDITTGKIAQNDMNVMADDCITISKVFAKTDLQGSADITNVPKLPFDASDVTFGTFHQNNDRYLKSSRGKQCTGNVLAMLFHNYSSNEVSSGSLDMVLDSGDELYRKIVASRSSACNFPYLNLEEIPDVLTTRNGTFRIHKYTIVSGVVLETNDISDIQTLQSALQLALASCSSVMITVGAICSGVFVKNGIYSFFYSHCHTSDGLSSYSDTDSGTSILISFKTMDNLIGYLYAFYRSILIDLDYQFNLLPIQFSKQSGLLHPPVLASEDLISNYFEDQRERAKNQSKKHEYISPSSCMPPGKQVLYGETKCKKSKRASYHKIYMEQRRKNQLFRENERHTELSMKRSSRADKEYRQKELFSKRDARTDKEYRQKERQKELSSKRDARTDKEYRQKELFSKRDARTDKEYRQKERQKELSSKRDARTDKEYRQKELFSKRDARTDKEYRQKERQKELSSKRDARTDKEYRQKERQKELSSKRDARTDKEYRQKERQKELFSKRDARTDNVYRHKERKKGQSSKRSARNNTEFKQNERVSDKNRKNLKRRDPLFCEGEKFASKRRKCGTTIEECIATFHSDISIGPVYVCTCCRQTWFHESVSNLANVSHVSEGNKMYFTGIKSVNNQEWICHTCLSSVKDDKVPKLSVYNGMKWPDKPKELTLHPLEERLVSLRIPFMQIRELPRGGQYSAKGNVVNVPVDIQPTLNALPRQMDENVTIAVKLKKRLAHRSSTFSENVRPAVVLTALHWLMQNSDMYRNSGIQIDDSWLQNTLDSTEEIVQEFICNVSGTTADLDEINRNDLLDNDRPTSSEVDVADIAIGHSDILSRTEEIAQEFTCSISDRIPNLEEMDGIELEQDNDTFSEIDATDKTIGNSDTLVDDTNSDTNNIYVFAPGENQRPLSLYQDKDAEYMSFPTIFCGQKRPENDERHVSVHYSDIAKWELRSEDRRAAQSVPNIFFKLKKIQMKQVSDKVNLAVRKCKTKGKTITAAEARDPATKDNIVKLNEGYYIFRTLRNSPAYLASKKKDVFAMIRQLGLPTWFDSLSAADTRWNDLLKILAKLNLQNDLSDDDIAKLTWKEKTELVQKDPVTCSRFFDHRVHRFINEILKSNHMPIGNFIDSFYRVEFQQRGSPHIHMIAWIKDAPKYKENTNEEIINFVEQFVQCSAKSDDPDMDSLIQLQVHKHSKACRKKGKAVCRFGFPLPPLRKTMILEPLETEVDKYKRMYTVLQEKLNDLKDGCDLSYEEFLQNVVELSEEEYIKCIQSSLRGPKIFLKRQPCEMRVNCYNVTLLTAWRANMDMQFVLDPYACAMYIVQYISKSQRGISAMLDMASQEASNQNMDLKHQERHIGNKFLNFVEVSAQEACYLVLQMPLTRASRDVVFVNTSPPDERVFLLKQKSDLDNLPASSTAIQADNAIQRYAKRPKALEQWCLADYVAELDIKYPKKQESGSEIADVNEDDISADHDDSDDASGSWNSDVMLTLKNGIVIKKRKNPKVIRYVRYNKRTNLENYCRERILLFLPWRKEDVNLLAGYATYEDHYKSQKDTIECKANVYEHNIDELEQATQQAERDVEDYDEIAPNTQQVEAEDELEGDSMAENFVHFNPNSAEHKQYDIGPELGLPPTVQTMDLSAERISDEQYYKLMRTLNIEQREFFNHVMQWTKTMDEPLYAFLAGGAGVGKSVVIRALYQALHRYLCSTEGDDPNDVKILVCAYTGKAAYNVNGATIASAFHKKMYQPQQHMHADELNTFRTKYRNLKVIIIDEISMVGNKLLAFIHQRLQELTCTKQDFGGISIIAVGDLCQLQPIGDQWIFSDPSLPGQGLAVNLWKKHFKMHELVECMRQKDDIHYAELLNRLAHNHLTDDDRCELEKRCIDKFAYNYPKTAPHLFIENKFVNNFNSDMIKSLSTLKVTVNADTDVITPTKLSRDSRKRLLDTLTTDQSKTGQLADTLTIAVGMTYDITVNVDVNDGLTNGSTCIVKYIEFRQASAMRPAVVWVLFSDLQIGIKRRMRYKHLYNSSTRSEWTPIFETKRTFLFNRKTFERIQFPLHASAAKTVHKAQGCTLDEVVVDMSQTKTRRIPHIHYVALSRVRSLNNLHILNFNEQALTVDRKVELEMERLRKESPLHMCFTPIYKVEGSKVKIMFSNARSLHKHFADISVDPNVLASDLVGIAESRLVDRDKDGDFALEGYDIFRNDERNKSVATRPHHGLVLYIKKSLPVQKVTNFQSGQLEFICVTLQCTMGEIQVVILYKYPACTLNQFMNCARNELLPLLNIEKQLVIIGDFNFDLEKGNKKFLQFMLQEVSCTQFIEKITTDYGSRLDLIFSNCTSMFADVVETYWSDHKMV